MAGFVYAPFGDLDAVRRLIDDETAAIMIEPIQGEGGVAHSARRLPAGLRELADEHELLLMFDEVQTGCGRTGEWFAYQHFGVTPDVMTLPRPCAAAWPAAAMLTTAEIAPSLRPGMHAATFGGNPIAARAGMAAIEMIEQENLLGHAKRLGELFRERLDELRQAVRAGPRSARLRRDDRHGACRSKAPPTVQACLERKLLINCTHGTVIRLLPAMNLSEEQAHEGCDILADGDSSSRRIGRSRS